MEEELIQVVLIVRISIGVHACSLSFSLFSPSLSLFLSFCVCRCSKLLRGPKDSTMTLDLLKCLPAYVGNVRHGEFGSCTKSFEHFWSSSSSHPWLLFPCSPATCLVCHTSELTLSASLISHEWLDPLVYLMWFFLDFCDILYLCFKCHLLTNAR